MAYGLQKNTKFSLYHLSIVLAAAATIEPAEWQVAEREKDVYIWNGYMYI